MYDLLAQPLQFFYGVWPNYAGAIALLTLSIMIVLLPLTLKGTRSMLAMQKLQPEMKKLQAKHRDDRQKLNEEMMKFYKENNINPVSGCFPLLLQAPVFFFLYRILYQLINRAPYGSDMGAAVSRSMTNVNGGVFERFGYFRPHHLNTSSQLYQDLSQTHQMRSFGLNLSESTSRAVTQGLTTAAPFIALVLLVTATSFYQQRQIAGRNPQAAQANPQQAMLMKIMPLFFAAISFTLPAAIVVYFLVSNLFRIGQQGLITRTMYAGDDAVLATSGRETDETSIEPVEKPKGFFAQLKEAGLPDPKGAREGIATSKAKTPAKGASSPKAAAKTTSKGSAKASSATKGSGSKSISSSKATTPPKGKATPGAKSAGGRSTGGAVATTTTKASSPNRTSPSRSAPAPANRSRNKKKRK